MPRIGGVRICFLLKGMIMRKLSLVMALAVLACSSNAPTSPTRKATSALRDASLVAIPAPVLISAAQVPNDSVRVTWQPYVSAANVRVWGSVQGFADAGASTHVIGAFVYQETLASGGITVPLDPNTQVGSTVSVTLFVTVSDTNGYIVSAPPVVSNTVTFVDGAVINAATPRKGHHGK